MSPDSGGMNSLATTALLRTHARNECDEPSSHSPMLIRNPTPSVRLPFPAVPREKDQTSNRKRRRRPNPALGNLL